MAVHEIHVRRKPQYGDPRGKDFSQEAERVLGKKIGIKTSTVYRIETDSVMDAARLGAEFVDAVVDESVNPLSEKKVVSEVVDIGVGKGIHVAHKSPFPVVEVGYKPEVTDPVQETIKKMGRDMGISVAGATVSTHFEFDRNTSQEEADQIASRLLINKTVQQEIDKFPETLVIKSEKVPVQTIPLMDASEEDLLRINKEQKTNLSLSKLQAMQKEARRRERDFTDAEFHYIDGAWSNHCVHEDFGAEIVVNGVTKPSFFTRIKEGSKHRPDLVATAFDDNSGGIYFYDGQVILVKWETHNSPSALEPKGGAATGSGGVFRDIMGTGKGAKVIMSADVFMTGPTDMDPELLPKGCIAPDTLLRGVVAGVRDYGNPMGVPTMNGSVYTHEDFRAKPTILVGAYGIVPEEFAQKGTPEVGDRVVAIGAPTGRDGIHGASFSSVGMRADTVEINSAAVQIGNPIEEKKMTGFILAARDAGYIKAITDCGAAGFGSAVGEIGSETGVTVDMANAPVKYQGLAGWEKFMSESQERMVVAVSPDDLDDFIELGKRFDVESADLGFFDGSNKLQVADGDEDILDLDYDFIKNGRPKKTMTGNYMQEDLPEPVIEMPKTEEEWIEMCKKILAHDNVCSKRPITEQYDSTVQGKTVMGPFAGVNFDGPTDAAIVKPIFGKPYGMITSHGTNPLLNRLDPRRGTHWAAAEALSNLVAAGGDFRETALCGNYITPVLEGNDHYVGAVDIMIDAMTEFKDALNIDVISGKDSVSSTYYYDDGREPLHIPIVFNVATLGRMPDVACKMTTSFKNPGSTIVMVGKMHKGMGGSVYHAVNNIYGGEVPEVDLEVLPNTFDKMTEGAKLKEIKAAHDNSDGGVMAAVAEMCFGGDLGVDLDIDTDFREDTFLYNQTSGVFVTEVESAEEAQRLFGDHFKIIGKTTEDKKYSVKINGRHLFTADVDEFKSAWEKSQMASLFH